MNPSFENSDRHRLSSARYLFQRSSNASNRNWFTGGVEEYFFTSESAVTIDRSISRFTPNTSLNYDLRLSNARFTSSWSFLPACSTRQPDAFLCRRNIVDTFHFNMRELTLV